MLAAAAMTGGRVALRIYSVSGALVTELVNETVASGHHTATWDGRDRYGNDVAAGVYYFILDAGDARQVGKMIRLR